MTKGVGNTNGNDILFKMVHLSYKYNKQNRIIFITNKIINDDSKNNNNLNFVNKYFNACWCLH